MKTEAVIVAAGSSRRAGCDKITYRICGRMLLEYSLDAFVKSSLIDKIILVVAKKNVLRFQRAFRRIEKIKAVVAGGRWRGESVLLGLQHLDKETKFVFIHDGARPLVKEFLIKRIWQALREHKAVIPTLAVRDTVKLCRKKSAVRTLQERENLRFVHTPQAFWKDIIIRAYSGKINWQKAYDDAFLVEKKKLAPVKIVESYPLNFKVTFKEDLLLAKKIIEAGRCLE